MVASAGLLSRTSPATSGKNRATQRRDAMLQGTQGDQDGQGVSQPAGTQQNVGPTGAAARCARRTSASWAAERIFGYLILPGILTVQA